LEAGVEKWREGAAYIAQPYFCSAHGDFDLIGAYRRGGIPNAANAQPCVIGA
jgi:hypothetical protein